jgi:hypothetical protein
MISKHASRLLLAGLALGVAFDVLFNGPLPGISLLIFAAALLVTLGAALRWARAPIEPANLWLPAGLLFFAAMGFVRANEFLIFLNICAGLALIILMAVYGAQRSVMHIGLLGLCLAPLQAFFLALGYGGKAVAQVARHDLRSAPIPARGQAAPILRGLLLAGPVVVVFAALLASADLVFADLIERIFRLDLLEALARWAGHGVVALTVGFLLAGGLAYAARPRGLDASDRLAAATLPRSLRVGVIEASVVIHAVNALFFVFMLIQIPYLFGGQVNIVEGKFTYAEYARRGFGELVFVALLVLGMTLLLNAMTRRETAHQATAFNLAASILLALTALLLASAFKRLWLYELAYGFTRMRVYPHVFMVWLAALLAWFGLALWIRPRQLAIGILIAGLGFAATLNLLNPDAFIVRQNLQRYAGLTVSSAGASHRTPEVDARYLTQLSEDAVPELAAAVAQTSGKTREALEAHLADRLKAMEDDPAWRRWQAFHVARYRAYAVLSRR